jgi:hypothetical protein
MVARGEALRTPGNVRTRSSVKPRRGGRGSIAPPGLRLIGWGHAFQGFAKPHPWLPSVAPPGLHRATTHFLELWPAGGGRLVDCLVLDNCRHVECDGCFGYCANRDRSRPVNRSA